MEHNIEIQKNIESILLFKGQAVSYKELSTLCEIPQEEIKPYIEKLSADYQEKGIRIVFSDAECEIVTSPESSELISKLQKQELESELSNASLETLSIILYMGPIARSMIDFIRGVNSQFTLRSLLIRGLIEKDGSSKTPMYQTTLDTIKFLGLNSIDELPNFKEVKTEIKQFIKDNSKDGE
jgi:segregation and condensation protein B